MIHQWARYPVQEEDEECLSVFHGSTAFCCVFSAIVFVVTLFGLVDQMMDARTFKQVWFVTAALIITWFFFLIVYYRRHVGKWFKDNGCLLVLWSGLIVMVCGYVIALSQLAIHLI
jgi:hypothetical protein